MGRLESGIGNFWVLLRAGQKRLAANQRLLLPLSFPQESGLYTHSGHAALIQRHASIVFAS